MKYVPIDCNYYDRLEALAVRRKVVDIVYEVDGSECLTTSRIVDLYSKEQVEYMQLESGDAVRLDDVISVDGVPRPR